jgi:hypothetical protein
MKLNVLKTLLLIISGFTLLVSCDDAIEIKPKYTEDYLSTNKSEGYYKALRDYKKSDHQVAFGWYGNWTGVGASLANCLSALPDSTDFVSLWGCWKNPTKEMLKDLRYVQETKGMKALVCFIILDVGDQITPEEHSGSLADRQAYWGWKDGDSLAIDKSIRKYANAICDTIDKYKYDGFDLDWNLLMPSLSKRRNLLCHTSKSSSTKCQSASVRNQRQDASSSSTVNRLTRISRARMERSLTTL